MSTASLDAVTCPSCGHGWQVVVYRGLRIARLPHVREAILRGDWQVFGCPGCGTRVQVHRYPVVYTDFPRGIYIAVEGSTADVDAALARHRAAFDDCFTFGPEVAEELGSGLSPRLVFGMAALREKLLLMEGGLDDVVVEAVKGDLLTEEGLAVDTVELRLLTVLPGGHLLFARLPPFVRSDAELAVVPPRRPIGFSTVPAWKVDRRAADRVRLLEDWPKLRDGWVIDVGLR